MTREIDPLAQEAAEFQALVDRAVALQRRAVNPVAAEIAETLHAYLAADDLDGGFDFLDRVLTEGKLPQDH